MAQVKNNETLNFQIDKLSEAIESMMKGFETLQTPRILDSEISRIRPENHMHVRLTGDDDISEPDSFCKEQEYDPEKMNLYYDRASMINEDYRAFEARKVENSDEDNFQNPFQATQILECICDRIQQMYGISLPFNDIEDFFLSLQSIFEKQIDCSLVELHGFILKLCDIIQKEQPISAKINIADTIVNINVKERPRRRFQKADYSAQYDSVIEKLLMDKDLPDEVLNIGRVKKNLLVNINLEKMRNLEIDFIRQDLEQRACEIELLKKKFYSQLESLAKFSKQMRQKDIELIKFQEKLETEREEFQQEKHHIEDLEVNFSAKIQEVRTRILEICPDLVASIEIKPQASNETSASTGRFSPICPQFRTSTPVLPTRALENNDELSALQRELSMLESQPQDSSNQLRIIRLKTQISAIRSTLAMNNSLRNSTGYIGKMNNEHRRNNSNSSIGDYPICVSPIPRSGCSSPVVPDALLNNGLTKRVAPKPLPPGPRKAPVKQKDPAEELEIVRNHLRLQESRLKEREDLVGEKENRLHRT